MKLNAVLMPFVCGLLGAPLLVAVHELGHYAVGKWHGFTVRYSYAAVRYDGPPGSISDRAETLITLGGPMVEVVVAMTGWVLVRRLRRDRGHEPASVVDWLASSACVLAAGRWLRCVTGTPQLPQPADEAMLSGAMGLPVWVLPYGLAPLSLLVIVAVIRQHPTGQRLVPFLILCSSAVGGLALWFGVVGPTLFPRS
ncbi:MAG: hypothetical protein JNN01_04460 [Opitutaceae bacterium]|nr:hypothetical protein [Opitutaceae bacterium]